MAHGGAPPVGGGGPVVDVGSEYGLTEADITSGVMRRDYLTNHGGGGIDPGQSEHEADTEKSREKADPLVVIFKSRSPTGEK